MLFVFESIIVPIGIYILAFVISFGIAILISGVIKLTQAFDKQ